MDIERLLDAFQTLRKSTPDVARVLKRRCMLLHPRGEVTLSMREAFVAQHEPAFAGVADYEVRPYTHPVFDRMDTCAAPHHAVCAYNCARARAIVCARVH